MPIATAITIILIMVYILLRAVSRTGELLLKTLVRVGGLRKITRLEFFNLHAAMRLPAGTEACAKWTSFRERLETKLSAFAVAAGHPCPSGASREIAHPPNRWQRICANLGPCSC